MGMKLKAVLPQEFYLGDPAYVAKKLLGKVLCRVYQGKILAGVIVETEAYYGKIDPASRAYRSNGDLTKTLYGDVGKAIVYGVHGKWLFNVVAHLPGEGGGVLIRALEPIMGIGEMKKLRGVENVFELTNGPGKLSQALAINKSFHKIPVYLESSPITIRMGLEVNDIAESFRIGVTKDLPTPLRFYVRGSRFVSKP